jgi:hypothetical protein
LIDQILLTTPAAGFAKPAMLYSALQQEAFEENIESGDRDNVIQLFMATLEQSATKIESSISFCRPGNI